MPISRSQKLDLNIACVESANFMSALSCSAHSAPHSPGIVWNMQVCVGDVCCMRLHNSYQYRRVRVEELGRESPVIHEQVC